MSAVLLIKGHMYDRTHMMAGFVFHTDTVHQLLITDLHSPSVHPGRHTVTADLFYIRYSGLVDEFVIGQLKAPAYGM